MFLKFHSVKLKPLQLQNFLQQNTGLILIYFMNDVVRSSGPCCALEENMFPVSMFEQSACCCLWAMYLVIFLYEAFAARFLKRECFPSNLIHQYLTQGPSHNFPRVKWSLISDHWTLITCNFVDWNTTNITSTLAHYTRKLDERRKIDCACALDEPAFKFVTRVLLRHS